MIPTNGEGVPIVASDLDGTLGDWHSHFIEFAANWTGKPMPSASVVHSRKLRHHLGLSVREYRELKLAFRQGGLKRFMPVYAGVGRFSESVRLAGGQFWIATTRPYLRLDNIDPDTREWLRRAEIQYDGLLYGDDKYRELKRQVGPRVAVVIDDLPEMLFIARKLFPEAIVAIRDQPYNQHIGPGFERVRDAKEMWMVAARGIREWRDRNVQ